MSNLKIYSVTSITKMKSNPHYAKAKQGDLKEAKLLIDDLMKGKKFPIGNETIVPVIAQESGGRNKIPLALAMQLQRFYGNKVDLDIIQAVRANHTGSNAVNRLKNVVFKKNSDQPLNGKTFVIVDDHITMGGTVASLAKFIHDNGGKVDKAFSLSNNTRQIKLPDGSQDITPSKSEIAQARNRFGSWVEEFSGMKYEEMSKQTIQYLLRFKSIEALKAKCSTITASMALLSDDELHSLWFEFNKEYLENLM